MKKLLCTLLAAVMLLAVMPFAASAGEKITFSDVKEKRWSYNDIMYAVENGYMNGVGEGKFDPAGKVTRGMVVTVLYRLAGSPETGSARMKFTDVKAGKWYYDAVLWASSQSIVKGLDNRTFGPENNITREQLAAIMCRYAEYDYVITDKKANITGYSDYKNVSSYARDTLAWCAETGLVTGVTDKTLEPKGSATREQFAAIMNRYDHAGYKFPETQVFSYQTVYNNPVLKSEYTETEYPLQDDADIFVSVSGNDANDGKTKETAVKSFAHAADLAKALKETKTGDIKVAFMAGEYGVLDNLTLDASYAGNENQTITYCAYGDGDVVFNNGTTLYGKDFKALTAEEEKLFPYSDVSKIKKMSLSTVLPKGLPEGASLYGGSTLLWEARIPNRINGADEYFKYLTDTTDDSKHNVYDLILIAHKPMTVTLNKYAPLEGGKIGGYIMFGWRVDEFGIESYDTETNIIKFDKDRLPSDFYNGPDGGGVRTPQMELDEVYFSDLPQFLDADGEYWYNKESNTIYVWNPQEEYNIAQKGNLLSIMNCGYTTIRGLTFRNALNDSAVNVRSSQHVTIDRCKVSGVTGETNAVGVGGDSYWFTFTNNEVSEFAKTGLSLYMPYTESTLEPCHALVENNYFHDFGSSLYFGNSAIYDATVKTEFRHNIFRNGASAAIRMGTLSVIEYNVFDNLMSSTQDFGAIYTGWTITSGRGSTIRYNLFENIRSTTAQYAIYLDDFSQEHYVYGNIFYHAGSSAVVLHNGRDAYIHDNAFIDSYVSLAGGGFFNQAEGGFIDEFYQEGATDELINRFNKRPKEGEQGYEIWKETFPTLYDYVIDTEDCSYRNCLFCHYVDIHNNLFNEGASLKVQPGDEAVGDYYGNINDPENKLPTIFADPTHGDYTVRDDSGFFKIPFDQIGRK